MLSRNDVRKTLETNEVRTDEQQAVQLELAGDMELGANGSEGKSTATDKPAPKPEAKTFSLGNRGFLGCKTKLLAFITSVVLQHCVNVRTVADLFCGTGVVAAAFADKKLITNDLLYSNHICHVAFFDSQPYSLPKIEQHIAHYNALDVTTDNYMSDNFADTYFSLADCRKIGFIREDIERIYTAGQINSRERALLITSLLYAADKVANTVGHYDNFLKAKEFGKPLEMLLPLPTSQLNGSNACYNEDANELVKRISADLVYLDLPYNHRQYCDQYHVLENIAVWNKPEVKGKTLKMDRSELRSDYCTAQAVKAFEDLIQNIDARYILLSYSDCKDAKTSDADIMRVLSAKGEVKVFSQDYKAFEAGKTKAKVLKERLFLCTTVRQNCTKRPATKANEPVAHGGFKNIIATPHEQIQRQLTKQSPSGLRVADLFCGAGGASLGYQNAGFEVFGFENWDTAADTHDLNFKNLVYRIDLSDVPNAVRIIRALKPFIVTGSPPCQDFSTAGKRIAGNRAVLTVSFAEIVVKVKPRYFVMENVPAVQQSAAYMTAREMFKQAGYGLTEIVLTASNYGVPQRRKRFFCIGALNAPDGFLTRYLIAAKSPKEMTMRDYFGDSLGIEHYYTKPPYASGLRRTIYSIDEPSCTVRGVNANITADFKPHKGDSCVLSPSIRKLTYLERAQIQTFPPDFDWEAGRGKRGGTGDIELMIGNAIPVRLAEAVARCILEYDKAQAGAIPKLKTTTVLSDNTGEAIPNVVAYCRTARNDGNAGSSGVEQQLGLLKRYASKQGWTLSDTYVDAGFSGTNFERPSFQRLLRDIDAGRVNCVLVKNIDRLGRGFETERYIKYFYKKKVRFIAIGEGIDTRDGLDYALNLLGAINGFYPDFIFNRVQQGKRKIACEGKFTGGQAPYGYIKSPNDNNQLVPDVSSAQFVRRIFEEFAAGVSTRIIVTQLNASCIDSPRNYKLRKACRPLLSSGTSGWTTSTVLQILRNQAYIGNLVSRKSELLSIKTGERVQKAPEDWFVVEDTHEPLISKDLWNAVQIRLNARVRGSRHE